MRLSNGKFYDEAGNVVPLEFEIEQDDWGAMVVKLLKTTK